MTMFKLGDVVYAKSDTAREIPLTIIGISSGFYLVHSRIRPSVNLNGCIGCWTGEEDKRIVLQHVLNNCLPGYTDTTPGTYSWLNYYNAESIKLNKDGIASRLIHMYVGL